MTTLFNSKNTVSVITFLGNNSSSKYEVFRTAVESLMDWEEILRVEMTK
jgi:hypothetical protein